MAIIYEPKGKAKEYSPLAANLYRGCSHGCSYCFAPSATFTPRDKFINQVSPRKDVIKNLQKDMAKFKGEKQNILLSFTSDPYQPVEKNLKITRQALEIMTKNNLNISILTKGGVLACRDFDLLSRNPRNEFAVTLTCDDPDTSLYWEPGASLPSERIESLKQAKKYGIRTWVSFEPVVDPEAVYRLLTATHEFVDFYKVGKLNYHKFANTINWPEFREKITDQLQSLGKEFLIKKDLLDAI